MPSVELTQLVSLSRLGRSMELIEVGWANLQLAPKPHAHPLRQWRRHKRSMLPVEVAMKAGTLPLSALTLLTSSLSSAVATRKPTRRFAAASGAGSFRRPSAVRFPEVEGAAG